MKNNDLEASALAVIDIEAKAVAELKRRIDGSFAKACGYMLDCQGRIVVIGMGKSSHIGHKIASTLASTGTPAFFVHPGEASHGDLGMITNQDVVLAISNSGKTNEILTLIPLIKRLQIPMITLTGNPQSPLATAATINLNVGVAQEACPLDLAPTSSTTAALGMGDALAISLLQAKGFTKEDFALSHPGGLLGRRLLLRLEDVMHSGDEIPQVSQHASVKEALIEMTSKRLGMTTVVNGQQQLVGIYTDGDIRRLLNQELDIHQTKMLDVMTTTCKTADKQQLAVEGLNTMQTHKITSLVVVDANDKPVGIVHMHDLLIAGVV